LKDAREFASAVEKPTSVNTFTAARARRKFKLDQGRKPAHPVLAPHRGKLEHGFRACIGKEPVISYVKADELRQSCFEMESEIAIGVAVGASR